MPSRRLLGSLFGGSLFGGLLLRLDGGLVLGGLGGSRAVWNISRDLSGISHFRSLFGAGMGSEKVGWEARHYTVNLSLSPYRLTFPGGGGDGKTFGMVFPGPGGWYSPRAAGELRERGGVAAAALETTNKAWRDLRLGEIRSQIRGQQRAPLDWRVLYETTVTGR